MKLNAIRVRGLALVRRTKAKLAGKSVNNLAVTTADGETNLYIEATGEGDTAQVGDYVFIGTDNTGEPAPDGDHTLADGSIITVKDGAITEITSVVVENTDAPTQDEVVAEMAAQLESTLVALSDVEAELSAERTAKAALEARIVALEARINGRAPISAKGAQAAAPGGDPVSAELEAEANAFLQAAKEKGLIQSRRK